MSSSTSRAIWRRRRPLRPWSAGSPTGSAPPVLSPLAVVERNGYGWMELARAKSCRSRDEVAEFYRRAGALLGLAYVLCAHRLPLREHRRERDPARPGGRRDAAAHRSARCPPPDRCGPTGPGRPQRLGLRHRDAAGLALAGRRPRLRQQRPRGRGPTAGRAGTGPGDQGAGERPAPGREAGGCGRPRSRHRPRVHCHVPRRAGPPHPPGRPGRAAGRGSARPRCG